MNGELFLTGIGILALMAVWKLMWMKSILDDTRDHLFDLRDTELHNYFVENGLSFEHPMYVRLRKLLNGHLRNTESTTIWELMFAVGELTRNPTVDLYKTKNLEKHFYTEDVNLKKFIEKIRFQSAMVMFRYMLYSSLITVSILILCYPFELIKKFRKESTVIAIKLSDSLKLNSDSRLAMELSALN